MEATKDDRFVLSAVNRDLLKKGLIGLLAFLILVGLFSLIVKPKYFFKYNGETLVLCEGRIGWLDGHPVAGFNPLPLIAEDAKEIAGQKFATIEEAKEALLAFAEANIKKRRAEVRALEQKLVSQYRALLDEYLIAKEMGSKSVDKEIKALKSWLDAFGQPEKEVEQKEHKSEKKEEKK